MNDDVKELTCIGLGACAAFTAANAIMKIIGKVNPITAIGAALISFAVADVVQEAVVSDIDSISARLNKKKEEDSTEDTAVDIAPQPKDFDDPDEFSKAFLDWCSRHGLKATLPAGSNWTPDENEVGQTDEVVEEVANEVTDDVNNAEVTNGEG